MKETGAFGDFAGTINTASNTLKQLNESLKETGMWIGQLTLVYLEPFLTKILGITIAIREMIKSLNIMQGYRFDQVRDDANSLFGEVENSAEDAAEAIEQVKNTLLGFDKLNILGSTDSNGIMPDYKLITDQLLKYSSTLDGVKNKANELAENVLKWLGYTKQVTYYTDENGNEIEQVNWQLKEGETNLTRIKQIVETILKLVAGFFVIKKVTGLVETLGKAFNLLSNGGFFKTVTSVFGKVSWIVAIIIAAVESFREMYNKDDGFAAQVNETFNSIKESIEVISQRLTTFWNNLKNNETIKWLINLIKTDLAYGVKMIIDLIDTVLALFSGDFDKFGAKLKNLLASIGETFGGFFDIIDKFLGLFGLETDTGSFLQNSIFNADWWGKLVQDIKNWFVGLPDWFNQHIWKPIGNFFIMIINAAIHAFESFLNFFVKGINGITGALSKVWTWTGIPEIGKINEVSFGRVPMLADGGVITRPTMAVMGEYSGAGSNPEIATPESLMRKVFLESMLPIAQAIVRGDKEVVDAIDGLSNRPIQLNGRKVSESIYNDLQNEAIRRGTTLAFS